MLTEIAPPPKRTPMKKPAVTTPHAASASCDGSLRYAMKPMMTVNGRTSPRATWERGRDVVAGSAPAARSDMDGRRLRTA